MSTKVGMQVAVAADRYPDRDVAMQGAHDRLLEQVDKRGHRLSPVEWRIYEAHAARHQLDLVGFPEPGRSFVLAKLAEFAPAVLIIALVDFEPRPMS